MAATIELVFVHGIDPGLSRCGYCVIDAAARSPRVVAMGVFRTPPERPVAERLAELLVDFRSVLDEFPAGAVAIERVLFQTNVRTAMSVGQASGVLIAEAAGRGVPVVEYSPNEVKSAVAGHGSADKAQVQEMVRRLLGLSAPPRPADAADAAAIALTHVAMGALGRSVERAR